MSIEALEQLDIRVGTILSVEDVAGSRKLVRLTVDFGDHTRAILSGMKGERKNLQELVGRQALFVVNLEPRRMAGLTSRECCSTWASPTALLPPWQSPNIRSPTAPAPADSCSFFFAPASNASPSLAAE